jgi:hypothetical protein
MIESLAWLSEEGADDCFFGGAISSREFDELLDVAVHRIRLLPSEGVPLFFKKFIVPRRGERKLTRLVISTEGRNLS